MPGSLSLTAAWILLFIAGILEIVWSLSMKASAGFTKLHFTALTLATSLVGQQRLNPAFKRTAASALSLLAMPSSLRSSAAAQRKR
jgi:hypothetical protein